MEAIQALIDEHRVIERVLDALEKAVRKLETDETTRAGFFLDAADFVKGFVDNYHHNKEEIVLFPALEAAGVPREGGPIGVMLADHEQGRQLTYEMQIAAERLAGGDIPSRGAIVWKTESYISLARGHMVKEESMLFPMVETIIKGQQLEELAEAFRQEEEDSAGEGGVDRYRQLATALEQEGKEMAL